MPVFDVLCYKSLFCQEQPRWETSWLGTVASLPISPRKSTMFFQSNRSITLISPQVRLKIKCICKSQHVKIATSSASRSYCMSLHQPWQEILSQCVVLYSKVESLYIQISPANSTLRPKKSVSFQRQSSRPRIDAFQRVLRDHWIFCSFVERYIQSG